jgi:hypothetical protein
VSSRDDDDYAKEESSVSDREDIIETLARYTRAIEARDGDGLAALFEPDGELLLFSRYGREDYIALDADVVGHDAIRAAMTNATLAPGSGMHYLTTDHIVDIVGGDARMHSRFVVLDSTAKPRPDEGWPRGSELMQGQLTVSMIGYYQSHLRKRGDTWLLVRHEVRHSLPMALPSKPGGRR